MLLSIRLSNDELKAIVQTHLRNHVSDLIVVTGLVSTPNGECYFVEIAEYELDGLEVDGEEEERAMPVDTTRLRKIGDMIPGYDTGQVPILAHEAADEIDALRKQLAEAKAKTILWRDGPARGGAEPWSQIHYQVRLRHGDSVLDITSRVVPPVIAEFLFERQAAEIERQKSPVQVELIEVTVSGYFDRPNEILQSSKVIRTYPAAIPATPEARNEAVRFAAGLDPEPKEAASG